MFKFTMVRQRVWRDATSTVDWQGGTEVSVLAETQPEAVTKAHTLSGPPASLRRWAFRVTAVEEVIMPQEVVYNVTNTFPPEGMRVTHVDEHEKELGRSSRA